MQVGWYLTLLANASVGFSLSPCVSCGTLDYHDSIDLFICQLWSNLTCFDPELIKSEVLCEKNVLPMQTTCR